jgi:hypothetical protein
MGVRRIAELNWWNGKTDRIGRPQPNTLRSRYSPTIYSIKEKKKVEKADLELLAALFSHFDVLHQFWFVVIS